MATVVVAELSGGHMVDADRLSPLRTVHCKDHGDCRRDKPLFRGSSSGCTTFFIQLNSPILTVNFDPVETTFDFLLGRSICSRLRFQEAAPFE